MIPLAVALQFLFGWIPCVLHLWTEPTYPSIKPIPVLGVAERKYVDEWRWAWLNKWYANTEDGVSGKQAWVWDDAGHLVQYYSLFSPRAPEWYIAWCWNLRNNANNIKRPLRTDGLNKAWP